jgi:glycosyltransferase involved in cell wall biosynthesis
MIWAWSGVWGYWSVWPGFQVELWVAGRVSPEMRLHWEAKASIPLHFTGLVKGEDIPALDRSADLLFAADLHAACPNSVIEALACGLPVVALDSGALRELVVGDAGRVTPFGGDPWKLDPPDLDTLAQAEILDNPSASGWERVPVGGVWPRYMVQVIFRTFRRSLVHVSRRLAISSRCLNTGASSIRSPVCARRD